MTASEKLNQAAKIAQEAEASFPNYTTWFNDEVKVGRMTGDQFTFQYRAYELAKMQAAKRAIA